MTLTNDHDDHDRADSARAAAPLDLGSTHRAVLWSAVPGALLVGLTQPDLARGYLEGSGVLRTLGSIVAWPAIGAQATILVVVSLVLLVLGVLSNGFHAVSRTVHRILIAAELVLAVTIVPVLLGLLVQAITTALVLAILFRGLRALRR